jgi:Ni,Fe-hydrogenase III component G
MDVEAIFQTARLLLADWAEDFSTPTPNRLDVTIQQPQDLVTAVVGLRVKRLGFLAAITGLDPGGESQNLEVLYHFCTGPAIVTLRLQVPKVSASLPSLCEVIPSAEAFERELGEMFGITMVGLRRQEHLYLPDDWVEGQYPLRKEFLPQGIQLSN